MSLKVQLLPTSAGDTSQVQPLTTLLVNDTIALDAGSLGFALSPEKLATIEHVVLSHAHLDHTLSLPVAIDSAYPRLKAPITVHGTATTLAAMRKNLFNDEVWVDFSKFNVVGTQTPCLAFQTFSPGESFELKGVRFSPISTSHPVPTVGFLIETPTAAIIFSADTWRTDALWAAAGRAENLKAVLVECSFPDEMEKLAEVSGHLTPKLVAEETAKIGRAVQVYCVHLKPSMRRKILPQLARFAAQGIGLLEIGKVYCWE